jgi:hypothetical protein
MDWTSKMKCAAMADAATVCKQADRIAELETAMRTLADTVARVVYDASKKRIAFQCAQHVRDAMAKLNIATKD